jgi:hypothetical protein
MRQNSRGWLWLLLLLYAVYAAYWSQRIVEAAGNPIRAILGDNIPNAFPLFRILLGQIVNGR